MQAPGVLPVVWPFVPLCRSLDLVINFVIRYVVINTGYTVYFIICRFMCEKWILAHIKECIQF
jgi:hypothetical protein